MPATILKTKDFITVLREEHLTMRYYPQDSLLCNEWRGVIPSGDLRNYILLACHFVVDNHVEFILADYSRMSAPSFDDQVWVANHSADLLRHSRLRLVANVLANDLLQQLAIGTIYDLASASTRFESRDFVHKDDALKWLLPS